MGLGGFAGGRPFIPGGGGGSAGGAIGGGEGSGGMGGGGPLETVSTFQDDARLVEMTIYGIAALYDRFPARPKQEAPPAAPSTDASK